MSDEFIFIFDEHRVACCIQGQLVEPYYSADDKKEMFKALNEVIKHYDVKSLTICYHAVWKTREMTSELKLVEKSIDKTFIPFDEMNDNPQVQDVFNQYQSPADESTPDATTETTDHYTSEPDLSSGDEIDAEDEVVAELVQLDDLDRKVEQVYQQNETILDNLQEVSETESEFVSLTETTEVEQLHARIAQLENEIERLKVMSAETRLGFPTVENLLSFLPCFYRHFWRHVKPSDLAILVGSLEIPQVTSTFLEPDTSTILIKKQQFLELEVNDQQTLILFCKRYLSTNPALKLRLDMQDLFGE